MALKKKITMPNGLPLEYHRISLVNIQPNQGITIVRHSYLDESARQYEKDYASGLITGEPTFPYVDYEYVDIPYAGNIDALIGGAMEGAYELLKKYRPEFSDAENI